MYFQEMSCKLGLAKRDLWGLGAESWFVVASYPFAKMIPQCFAKPNLYSSKLNLTSQFFTQARVFHQNKRNSFSTLNFEDFFMLYFDIVDT